MFDQDCGPCCLYAIIRMAYEGLTAMMALRPYSLAALMP